MKRYDINIGDMDFWVKVNKTKTCWLWTASKTNTGYGTLGRKTRRYLAHRYSWIIHNGEIPNGMCVCHHCDTPLCVNPEHLFLGTQKDNMKDASKKGRVEGNGNQYGENCGTSKLVENDIRNIKKCREEGMLLREIADIYNIHLSNVSYIVNGNTWKHVL